MADRLLVAYKTPFQRLFEIALIVSGAIAATALWQTLLPSISPSYVIVAALIIGFAAIPRMGSLWAARHGAVMMTRDERNRRYLAELGPIGTDGPRLSNFAAFPKPAHAKRSSNRSRRRG